MGDYATRLTQIQQNADVANSALCPEWHISKTTTMDINMNRHIYSQKSLPSGNTIAQQATIGSSRTGTGTFSLRRAHYFNVQHDDAESASSLNEEHSECVADSEDALI